MPNTIPGPDNNNITAVVGFFSSQKRKCATKTVDSISDTAKSLLCINQEEFVEKNIKQIL